MIKDLIIAFTSPVINEQGRKDVRDIINNILIGTLYKRTYFWQLIHDQPFVDDYAGSDARTYFQCGLVCALKGEFAEAIEWYTLGSRWFTDSAVLYNEQVQCDYDVTDYKYIVQVMTWFNTPFGSAQQMHEVAEINCIDPHLSDFTGHDVTDRVAVLKDEWFALVAKERQCIAETRAALEELDAQMKGGK